MRSSKSRSRSKSNRPRTIGNIVNRVFDSSGPEGKVRGTPQQIIEKYQILARDAQLSNDRVAAENFQQHAEHYTRMLGEAMRELAAEQDQRRDGNQSGGQNANHSGNQNGGQNASHNANQNGNQGGGYGQGGYRDRMSRDDLQDSSRVVAVIDLADDADDTGLVETPEARARAEAPRSESGRGDSGRGDNRDRGAQPDRRDDRPRHPQQDRRAPPSSAPAENRTENRSDDRPSDDRKAADRPAPEAAQPVAVEPLSPMMPSFAPPEAAPATKPAATRRPRAPRKPKATDDGTGSGGPAEAAE